MKLPSLPIKKLGTPLKAAARALTTKPTFTPELVWRLGLVGGGLAIALLLTLLWMSGARDTRSAINDGRRLVIRLDSGSIEGKQVSLQPPPLVLQPATAPASSLAQAGAAVPSGAPPAAENPALIEKSDIGPLPIVADNVKPWRYYAKSFERKGTQPVVAIIITGLGESKNVTDLASKLPENVTLSFSPYAHDLTAWVAQARSTGHEAMVDLPLEPSNFPAVDPGPEGIFISKGRENNAAHLNWLMSRFTGYIGFLTPQNEGFSSDTETFKWLMKALDTRGLMLVVARAPANADTKQAIDTATSPAVTADALIDEELSPASIQARLSQLEQVAKDRGYAVGIAQAYPLTMQQIADWAARANADGVALVPVSFIVKLRF